MKKPNAKNLIHNLLISLGEDPKRQGLLNTPKRVAASYEALTAGYHKNLKDVLNGAIFDEEYDEMVIMRDIDLFSLCEHHLLPFYGKCHVAYIPNGKIIGLSKIPRIVDVFARRLQVQERLTAQIANCLMEALQPLGVKAVFRPISDMALACNEKKFSGNAQHRGKRHILHHGTILYAFDLELINRYLTMPKDVPAYRCGRPHADFVSNIPVIVGQFKASLAQVFAISAQPQPLSGTEVSLLKEFSQTHS